MSLATARNIGIILVIAAIVVIVPGGGTGASVLIQAISLAFLAALGWVASLMYRQNRTTLYGLGDARRAVLYAALVVATLLLAAGVGYDIGISPPMYLESALVEFSLPKTLNAPNAYYMFAPSLISSCEAMVQILMSPSAQRQIGPQAAAPMSTSRSSTCITRNIPITASPLRR